MGIYSQFFNFLENPFGETPDRRFYYDSPSHCGATKEIISSLKTQTSLTVISGEVGSGKTLLTRVLTNEKLSSHRFALILNPVLSPSELIHSMVMELDGGSSELNLHSDLSRIEAVLEVETKRHNSIVLLIDEAQCLPKKSVQALLKLYDYAQQKRFGFHIVLLGQPEILGASELQAFRHYPLTPLTFLDLKRYVMSRISVAGGSGFISFDEEAFREIFQRSGGLPRLINRFCELSLLKAEREKSRCIRKEIVLAALLEWPQLSTANTTRLSV